MRTSETCYQEWFNAVVSMAEWVMIDALGDDVGERYTMAFERRSSKCILALVWCRECQEDTHTVMSRCLVPFQAPLETIPDLVRLLVQNNLEMQTSLTQMES